MNVKKPKQAAVKKMTILEEAQNAVYGDRQADYGTVTDNFGTIAKLWSAVLKTEVTPEQVGLCMVQVKVARQMYKPKRDNLVGGAGYFATIEKMEDEQARNAQKIFASAS
jgi:hypothetical protein